MYCVRVVINRILLGLVSLLPLKAPLKAPSEASKFLLKKSST